MQIVAKRAELAAELQALQGVIARKATIPILNNVMLTMDGDRLALAATDLQVSMTTSCAASGVRGVATVPAAKLHEFVRELPEGDVTLTQVEDSVEIKAGRFVSKMPTLPPADYPVLPIPSGASETIPAERLRHFIERCAYAVTDTDTRFYMNGALLVGTTAMVATDGHRLSYARTTDHRDEKLPRAILPKWTLAELGKMLEKAAGDVVLSRGENNLFFEIGQRRLMSRLVDGQFPAFEKVIPTNCDKRAAFDRTSLLRAIQRVSIVVAHGHGIRFVLSGGEMTISATSAEYGRADEVIQAEYAGPDFDVALNPRYLLDFLASVDESESVFFEFRTPETQTIFRPSNPGDGQEFLCVVMPMRI